MNDTVNLRIHGNMYILNKEDIMKKSKYFKSMLSNFSEKNKMVIDIELDTYFDKNIVDAFILFIDKDTLSIKYCYAIYLLMDYFEFDKNIYDIFKNKIIEYNGDIDGNDLVSLYYLSNIVDYINLDEIFTTCHIDKNYLKLPTILNNIDINDFITIYGKWSKNLEVSSKYNEYLLIDILQFTIIYHPYTTISFKNKLNQYKEGDQITVNDIKEFKYNLQIFSHGLIDEDFNKELNWSNICIGGGSVLGTLLKKPLETKNSDIDFWIYGKNYKATFDYFVKYLESKFEVPIFYGIIGSVVTLVIPAYKRNIQIILTNKKSPYDIINSYDMDYVKCLYNGSQVLGTLDFLLSLQTQCVDNRKNILSITRITKAYRKGYSFLNDLDCFDYDDCSDADTNYPNNFDEAMEKLNDDIFVIKNKNKYYYPNKDELDDIERIKFMIKDILGSKDIAEGSEELFKLFTYRELDDKIDPYFLKDMIIDRKQIINNMSFKQITKTIHNCLKFLYLKHPIVIESPLISLVSIENNDYEDKFTYHFGFHLDVCEDKEFIKFIEFLEDIDKKLLSNIPNREIAAYSAIIKNSGEKKYINIKSSNKTKYIGKKYLYTEKNPMCKIIFTIDGIWISKDGLRYGVKKRLNSICIYKNECRYINVDF